MALKSGGGCSTQINRAIDIYILKKYTVKKKKALVKETRLWPCIVPTLDYMRAAMAAIRSGLPSCNHSNPKVCLNIYKILNFLVSCFLPRTCYYFSPTFKKAADSGLTNSCCSTSNESTFSAKLVFDKWKFGCH